MEVVVVVVAEASFQETTGREHGSACLNIGQQCRNLQMPFSSNGITTLSFLNKR